jgi:hypothetical protein
MCLRETAVRLHDLPEHERSLAKIIASIYTVHASDPTIRWGDKTPTNDMYLPELKRTFPDAKFIHLYRDGVDVIHSQQSSGLISSLDAAAERWLRTMRFVAKAKPWLGEDLLEVRYEGLVHDPASVVPTVCKFLSLSYRPEMLSEVVHLTDMGPEVQLKYHSGLSEAINVRSIGRGRERLNPETVDKLAPLLNPHLERYGYPPVQSSLNRHGAGANT